VLATIRYMESRGQYHLPPNKGNASGAYQFIGSTWGNYAGYAHAYLAPPAIQDERAAQDVTMFLDRWNNDVSMIPVLWYYPKAAKNPALMDIVPVPSAGNVLTIREYQQRWLAVFATISGQPIPQGFTLADAAAQLGIPPSPPLRDDDLPSVAFPVLGPSRLAAPDCDAADVPVTSQPTGQSSNGATQASRADIEAAGLCTPQAPSIVFGVKLQPILVAAEGVVTAVHDNAGSGEPITVTITDIDGRSYIYSGFNDDNQGTTDGAAPDYLRLTALAKVGQTVWAGQIIGFMGDTDPLPVGVRADVPTDATVVIDPEAVAPHIRLTIVDLDGTPVDAFGPVVDALFSTSCRAGIGPWSVPARSNSSQPIVIETTDDNDEIDSEWVITSTGQVTAAGWAAMINPSEFCTWTPDTAFGPGASGSNDVPGRWWFGRDLPTNIWLGLALNTDTLTAPPLIRF
jgi:hypothetical protein